MIIELNEQDLYYCRSVASMRSGSKEKLDRKEFRTSANPESFDRHFLGVKCEFACAKLFHTSIDSRYRAAGDKNDPDIILPDGRKCQIKGKFKHTKIKEFTLRTTDLTEFTCDIGILLTEESRTSVRIMGWFDRNTFIEKSCIHEFEWGPKRTLNNTYLKDIKELLSQFKPEHLRFSKETTTKVDPLLLEASDKLLDIINSKDKNRQTIYASLKDAQLLLRDAAIKLSGFG